MNPLHTPTLSGRLHPKRCSGDTNSVLEVSAPSNLGRRKGGVKGVQILRFHVSNITPSYSYDYDLGHSNRAQGVSIACAFHLGPSKSTSFHLRIFILSKC